MKKTVFLSALCLSLSALFFEGCKSSPEGAVIQVHPLALISEDLSIYVNVPVQYHRELTARLLTAEVPSISQKDAESLASRIGNLYAGLGTVKDRSYLEMSCDAEIPGIARKSVFSKKNGLTSSSYNAVVTAQENELPLTENFTIYSRSDMDFDLSFAGENILCVSKKINPMLDRATVRASVPQTDYAEWINRESRDILFYITRSGQYLNSLLGGKVTVSSDYVYGTIAYRPNPKKPGEYSGVYDLTFCVHLKDRRMVQAFKSMLSLSFALLDGEVKQIDEYTVQVSGAEISAKQIEDLFTRDPITGKHYRVVGEHIITESKK